MSDIVILDSTSQPIQYLCRKDNWLAKVIAAVEPISYTPKTENTYPFLVHEIIEQMVSSLLMEVVVVG